MIFAHCKLIQEKGAILFYRVDKQLKGYMIAGLIISSGTEARVSFAKIWKYFVSEIVRADDIYCSIPLDKADSLFINYIKYYDTINALRIYKVDNFLKEQYSSYSTAIKKSIKQAN